MISILSLKLSLLSITELKYLKLYTTSMGSLFLLTGTKTFVVKFVLAFSINHFVLPAFVSRKLSLHHSFKSETCEKYVARESSFNSNPTCATTSANLKRQVTAVCNFMWFVYMKKKKKHRWKDTTLGCPRIQYNLFRHNYIHITRCSRSQKKKFWSTM